MILEIKLEQYNFWGNAIYRTKRNTPIVKLETEGYFILSDPTDIDSDPDRMIKQDCIKVVEEFSESIMGDKKVNEWIYILDYANGEIYSHRFTEEEQNIEIDDFLKKYGLNSDECSWMFTQKPLTLVSL